MEWRLGKLENQYKFSWKCRQYPKIRAWVPGKLKECPKANPNHTKVQENYFELTIFCFECTALFSAAFFIAWSD